MAGLYIHIPFCGSRCAYCDFYSTTSPERIAEYVGAVKREMTARRDFLPGGRLDTVYIGGGTPSLLSPEQLQGLLDHAAGLWDCSALKEVTVEANPEDLSEEYLARLAGTGFTRLSIGVQSLDDGLLKLMNRRHDAARAKNAVRAAQMAGFGNISIDLIYGIPGMSAAQWEHTLDEAIALGVQHISAYHLTIEPGTAFGQRRLRPISGMESERQYETLRRKLGEAGFEHYEISNFALPGRRAVHNSSYWSGEPYLGVGPSAHSFDGARRREWVATNVDGYISAFSGAIPHKNKGSSLKNAFFHNTTPIYEGETLSDRDIFNERVMTSLRTSKGMDIIMNYSSTERSLSRTDAGASGKRACSNLPERQGGSPKGNIRERREPSPLTAEKASREGDNREGDNYERSGIITDGVNYGLRNKVQKLLRDGLLVQKGNNIAIPPEKFLLSDMIIGELFDAGD